MNAKIIKLIPVSDEGESVEVADTLAMFLANTTHGAHSLRAVRIMSAFAAYEAGGLEEFKKMLEV